MDEIKRETTKRYWCPVSDFKSTRPPQTLADGIKAEQQGAGRVRFVNGVATWQWRDEAAR
jgi:hypothetical protein